MPTFRVPVWAATAVATINGEGRKPSPVLVVLAEEAGVESHLFCQFRLGDNLVYSLVKTLAPGRVGDGAVDAEFHTCSPKECPQTTLPFRLLPQ